jgi:hypothetical protein
MAKVRNNVIIRGLSGSLGDQVVIKVDKAKRTIVGNKPVFPEDREFSLAQLAHQEKFREAALYAKDAKDLEVYVKRAEGTPMYSYNIALADYLQPPEIKEIDLSAWTGSPGETIRIQAVDDVEVKMVKVVITDANDVVLEQGPAVKEEGGWWTYQTTVSVSDNPKVVAIAEDLPGHTVSMTQILN